MAESESPAICFKCKQVIEQRIITALEKDWHPEHFTCKDCQQPIADRTFHVRDGEPVCSSCQLERYTSTCHGCNTLILGGTIRALGKTWHEQCFSCAGNCKQPLPGASFYEHNGMPYCRADYEQLIAPRCSLCMQPIIGNTIVALNGKWHRDCFRCKKCAEPIKSTTFAVENNQPVCKDCAHKN